MRIIRISVTVLFILTSIAFLVVFISQKKNEDNTIPEIVIETDFIEAIK